MPNSQVSDCSFCEKKPFLQSCATRIDAIVSSEILTHISYGKAPIPMVTKAIATTIATHNQDDDSTGLRESETDWRAAIPESVLSLCLVGIELIELCQLQYMSMEHQQMF
jgi:hypothetical protein